MYWLIPLISAIIGIILIVLGPIVGSQIHPDYVGLGIFIGIGSIFAVAIPLWYFFGRTILSLFKMFTPSGIVRDVTIVAVMTFLVSLAVEYIMIALNKLPSNTSVLSISGYVSLASVSLLLVFISLKKYGRYFLAV